MTLPVIQNMEIIQAAGPDFETLKELRSEALRYNPEAYTADKESDLYETYPKWETVLRNQNNPDGALFIAGSDSQPAGMAGVFRGISSRTHHGGTLEAVYVRPSFRARGVAKRLIGACIEWAREHKIQILKLAVTDSNIFGIKCYADCGFRVYGIEPKSIFLDKIYYNDVLMAREL